MKAHFEQFLSFRRSAIRTSTAATYRTDQAAFLRWAEGRRLTVQAVTRADIAEWMAVAQGLGQSNRVIMKRLATLRTFFAWAVDEGIRAGNPVDLGKLPKLKSPPTDRQPFTEEQFRRVVLAAAGPHVRPFWAPAVRLGWATGLRLGDVAGLLWAEIDLSDRILTRRAIKTRGTHAPTIIPLDYEALETLQSLWERPERLSSLFVLPGMQSLYAQARTTLCVEFRRLCDSVGLPGHSFHSLRHGFASKLVNSGVDSMVVASMTGQSIKILKGYVHVSTEAKRAALAKAGDALPKRILDDQRQIG